MRLVAIVALASSACVFDGSRRLDRPARFSVGVNSRQLGTAHGDGTIARSTTPQPPDAAARMPGSATTADFQFTMATQGSTYLGVEAEAGTLGPAGSNFAGGYGVAGIESRSPYGSLAFEVVGGKRWLRADIDSDDVRDWVAEGRVNAKMWLSPQLSFGAQLGANPRDESWMAGVALSIHSNFWNRWK
jgi:hypothetical protein